MLGATLTPQYGLLQENRVAETSPEQGHHIGESGNQVLSSLHRGIWKNVL